METEIQEKELVAAGRAVLGGDFPHIAARWAQSPPQKEMWTPRLPLYVVCYEGSLAHPTSGLPGKKKSAGVISDFRVDKGFGSGFSPRRLCINFN